MTLFKKWLRRESEPEAVAEDVEDAGSRSSAKPEGEKGGEYDNDTAFNWLGDDLDQISIPDSLSGTDDEKSSTDTVTIRTLAIPDDSSYTVEGDVEGDAALVNKLDLFDSSALSIEADEGLDPYNTTRLKALRNSPPGPTQ